MVGDITLKGNDVAERDIQLSVIITIHGQEHMLPKCIGSLNKALAGIESEIIIMNNLKDAEPASFQHLSGRRIRTITNENPQGLALNINKAAESAEGPAVLILASDVVDQA